VEIYQAAGKTHLMGFALKPRPGGILHQNPVKLHINTFPAH
jgi:hypothetical protein